jgi:hypothetical protein
MPRYSDIAYLEDVSVEMSREVDRICLFLLDAYFAHWAREFLANSDAYGEKVKAARLKLCPEPSTKTHARNATALAPQVLYWFDVRAAYWTNNRPPKPDVVPLPDLETLLEEAKTIQNNVRRALDQARRQSGELERPPANTDVPDQQLRAIEAVCAIHDMSPKVRK